MSAAKPGSLEVLPAIRPATARDLPRIVAAADAIFRNPPPAGLGSMGHDYPLLFQPDNAPNLLILEDARGDLLAHAGFVLREAQLTGTTVRVATIGAVFPQPEQRQRGLAARVLDAAVDRARQAGADLGLVSGQRTLYERAGFSPYPACSRYRVTAGPVSDTVAQVVPYSPEALPDLMDLNAREPVRFVRSQQDWQSLLNAGVLFFEPAITLLLRRDGKNVAYLAVGRPGPPADGAPGDPRGARVLELGGDRAEIAAAAPLVAQTLGVAALDLILPPGDQSLAALARQHGWPADEVRMPFTSTWWNPAHRALPLPFYGFNYV